MAACKLRIQLLCGALGLVLLSVLVASHGHSHDHHGHSHDHHGHSHGHGDAGHHGHHHGHSHDHHDHHHHDHHAHEDHRHFYHASSYSEDEGTEDSEPDLKTEPKRKSVNPEEYFARLKPTPGKTEEKIQMWLEAIGATILISAAPFLILFLIPLDKDQPGQENFLRVLLAFASGGLLGDAFLHLIPHAVNPHSHGGDDHGHSHEDHGHSHGDHGHDHSQDMMVGLWVLTGIILFLAIEKLVRHIKGEGHSHGHGHSHGPSKVEDKKEAKEDKKEGVRKRKTSDKETEGEDKEDDSKSEEAKDKGDKIEEGEKKESKEVAVQEEEEEIKVSAYLNLAADCTHNFTDGLAIGASFLVSRQLGIITTITILLHEVPHEIGDFAILVQSGCSKQKAMYLQLLTAVGALTGCICALLAEGAGDAATLWILPITAGGFIYIATVTVIPELLEKSSIKQSIVEIFALLAGVALMVLIAYAE